MVFSFDYLKFIVSDDEFDSGTLALNYSYLSFITLSVFQWTVGEHYVMRWCPISADSCMTYVMFRESRL
jgi:hypothetical protein